MSDNGIRKRWIVYHVLRTSLVTGEVLREELSRARISSTKTMDEMIAIARANRPPSAISFQILRARTPYARLGTIPMTEVIQCP